ncbi:hypothetical protein HanRHA438_Chr15g0733171 [Helianthus annuus]|nr:hypothetical protein HanRHA438_Chr15g0733171 [Helianthus annuus]
MGSTPLLHPPTHTINLKLSNPQGLTLAANLNLTRNPQGIPMGVAAILPCGSKPRSQPAKVPHTPLLKKQYDTRHYRL